MSSRFALIGPGRVGSAVAKALVNKGYHPVAIVGRDLETSRDACRFIGCDPDLATTTLQGGIRVDLILLAVPDDSIAAVAHHLQQNCNPSHGTLLIHFSGVHPAAIMRHPKGLATLFSLHPLLPFADRQQAFERLPLATYVGEGDNAGRPVVEALCVALGGQFEYLPAQMKPLYHAAACIASNFLVTLLAEATTLLHQCGLDRNRAETLLLPLVQATITNVTASGTRQGLTGPIVRGDVGTVNAHLQALQYHQPALLALYRQLGYRTTLLAQESGRLNVNSAQHMINLLAANHAQDDGKQNK